MAVEQLGTVQDNQFTEYSVDISSLVGYESSIQFHSILFANIFLDFIESFGETLKLGQLGKNGPVGSFNSITDKIVKINPIIAPHGLMIVNEYGVGYRLVQTDETSGRIKSKRARSLSLGEGMEVTIVSSQELFNLLEFMSQSEYVSVERLNSFYKFNPKLAMSEISRLRKALRGTPVEIRSVKEYVERGIKKKVVAYKLEYIES